MCGQVGLIFGKKRRRASERDYLCQVFTEMLLRAESRGPHATGAAWLKTDGEYSILKRPVPASELTVSDLFQETLEGVDNRTTALLGHTRWRTRGSEANSRNNHPIRAGAILGTHNGTIYNADQLFVRLGLPRFAEVDSEVIFRLADRFARESAVNRPGFKRALALCRGQMSAVLASRFAPWTILVLKGNKPLSLYLHRKHRVVAYASEAAWFEYAVASEKGWRPLEIPPMTMMHFEHQDIATFGTEPFRFTTQEQRLNTAEATGNPRKIPV